MYRKIFISFLLLALINFLLGCYSSDVVNGIEREQAFEKDDIYLLCSDGLSDMIDDKKIFSALVKSHQDLKRASETLVKLAKDNGGHDNVSVILVACK